MKYRNDFSIKVVLASQLVIIKSWFLVLKAKRSYVFYLTTLILFTIHTTLTQAQTYEGSIGKHNIFLELDIDYDDNSATAFYFYKSQLKNIQLEGTWDTSELMLYERFSEPEDKKELFRLSIKKDTLSGTWQNNTQLFKVQLTKTAKNLEDHKLQKLKFVSDSISSYGKKELVWLTEKHSGKQLFRLGKGFTKPQREFMNQKLDSIHTRYVVIGLECGWADFKVEIELISNQYLSFSEYSSIYCGGAHPSHNTSGYNFDFKNQIQFNKLTDLYPNLNHYKLLKAKYGKDTDLQEECEYFSGQELWDYYSWVMTKEGVTITPSFPYALTPCEMGFSLTYKELGSKN